MSAILDSRTRYAASAEQYQQHRPSYPSALIDWVIATTTPATSARVADVGCGTGIATRLFAQRGLHTIGIDPNAEMLGFARRAGLANYALGHAAALPLATGSIDLVVAAQCFHWFETIATLKEFQRVLRPDGWCAALWNLRGSTPVMDEYDALVRSYSTEYAVLEKQEAAPAALRKAQGVVSCREAELTNAQSLDREGLLGRAYSSSCIQHGVEDKPTFERELTRLFERHQKDSRIEFRYRTVGLCWKIDQP